MAVRQEPRPGLAFLEESSLFSQTFPKTQKPLGCSSVHAFPVIQQRSGKVLSIQGLELPGQLEGAAGSGRCS